CNNNGKCIEAIHLNLNSTVPEYYTMNRFGPAKRQPEAATRNGNEKRQPEAAKRRKWKKKQVSG
ncbi:MAG: hypothetical protein ABSG91_25915, partial [Syntrophobacteraceae bacterium]